MHPRIRLTLSLTSSFSEFQWGKNLDEFSTMLAVMLSSMPTAVNVAILAMEFNVRPRFVSSVVVVSTAASVFTPTLILARLGVR